MGARPHTPPGGSARPLPPTTDTGAARSSHKRKHADHDRLSLLLPLSVLLSFSLHAMARLLNNNKKILWQTQTVFSMLCFFFFFFLFPLQLLLWMPNPQWASRKMLRAGRCAALRNAHSHLQDRATESQGRVKPQPHHHKKVQEAQKPTGKPCWSPWLVGGSPREMSCCHEPHHSSHDEQGSGCPRKLGWSLSSHACTQAPQEGRRLLPKYCSSLKTFFHLLLSKLISKSGRSQSTGRYRW